MSNTMIQHTEAMQEIESKLQAQYANCTPIYGRHEFGRFAYVVNMAFAHWSDLDAVASNRNYDDTARNEAADKAAESLDIIKSLAKELFELERDNQNENELARLFADNLEAERRELAELDAVHAQASGRWGY